jgi:repressor LexA
MAVKDSAYLVKLQDYYARFRSFPSYARLCGILGLAAKSAVNKVLFRLAGQGYITRTPDGVWVPTPGFFERNLACAPVQAGAPTSASDMADEPFLIDQFLVRKPSKTTLIPVKGDSMMDAGIREGDKVVVEMRPDANSGDIVVAVIDNEFTVKTLGIRKGRPTLLPANPAYPVIQPDRFEIFGVVVGLVRKYGR